MANVNQSKDKTVATSPKQAAGNGDPQGAPATRRKPARSSALFQGGTMAILPGFPFIPALNIFAINTQPALLEEVVEETLSATSDKFQRAKEQEIPNTDPKQFLPTSEVCAEYVKQNGLSTLVAKISSSINSSALGDARRRILAAPGVYHYLLLVALEDEGRPPDDVEGILQSVLLNLEGDPEAFFYDELVERVLARNKINLNLQQDQDLKERLVNAVRAAGFSLPGGAVEAKVLDLVKKIMGEGDIPTYIQLFAQNNDIPPSKLTPGVQAAMLNYISMLGIKIQKPKFDAGAYDEFFALALERGLSIAAGQQDPLSLKYGEGSVANWDFSVEEFNTPEAQGAVPENVLAAGALAYVYVLGEQLGLYRVADALVLRWASGALDLAEGPATNKLYQYWKRRDDRSSEEERAALYKRVLNVGEGKTLSRSVVNEEFPDLWNRLMEEVTEYIRRSEGSDAASTKSFSRAKIYDATRHLQYNLTTHMTGMAHMQVREMHANLRDALDILGHPDIIDYHGGGRRKSMWRVVENIAKEEFGYVPNISALRTAAVEGNKVFRWVANFTGAGAVTEQGFESFLRSAESYILAQAAADGEVAGEEEAAEEEEEEDGGGDDFEDWSN